MGIFYFNEDIEFYLEKSHQKKLSEWIANVIKANDYSTGEINYIFCSDAYLLSLNQAHLNHNTYTDIITFDLSENSYEIYADIFISVERIKENSQKFNVNFSQEFARVVIHGILHLVGFKDKTLEEKKIMREKENFHLKYFDIEIT